MNTLTAACHHPEYDGRQEQGNAHRCGELYGDNTRLAQQGEITEYSSRCAKPPNGILCKLSAIAIMNQWWASLTETGTWLNIMKMRDK